VNPDNRYEGDARLLRRIARGEVTLIGELYDHYAATLFPTALRILRDHEEAEDVLHDVFVTVADRAGYYGFERGSVLGWLVTLVRNLAIDRLRRRRRRGSLERLHLVHEPKAQVASPEIESADARERTRIQAAIRSLPDSQRAPLERAFYEGLSYAEIATDEGLPVGTVKSRISRGIASLRQALGEEGRDNVRALDAE
jgi:RNA polymerase sigma-70 factor (ECF subfamily)